MTVIEEMLGIIQNAKFRLRSEVGKTIEALGPTHQKVVDVAQLHGTHPDHASDAWNEVVSAIRDHRNRDAALEKLLQLAKALGEPVPVCLQQAVDINRLTGRVLQSGDLNAEISLQMLIALHRIETKLDALQQ